MWYVKLIIMREAMSMEIEKINRVYLTYILYISSLF